MPVLSGYLFKLGQKGVLKFYKKRWFVIPENQDIIFYYESKLDMKLCGQINLKDILHTSTTKTESFNKGSTWGFELTTPGRVYYLYAATEHDRIYWIEGVTARTNQLKKKEEETKQKTFGIINDLKIWRKNAPPGSPAKGTNDEFQTRDEDDEDNSADDYSSRGTYANSSSNSTPLLASERMKFELELENKDNQISKLLEEKMAFEQYAKELAEEKQQLQKENDKIIEEYEVSKVEELISNLRDLEKEKEEMLQDFDALKNELEEEKAFRSQILKDKNNLEKNFDAEKSQLIHIAEESESGMKKAIQLMQSGSGMRPTMTKVDWGSLAFSLERSAARYRKTKESYFHENIRLKKKLDESLRSQEKERPLAIFEEIINKLKSQSENPDREALQTILPIANSEVNQLREFIDANSSSLSTANDTAITDYLGQDFKPDEMDVDMGGDLITEDEYSPETKIKMKFPLGQAENQIKNSASEITALESSGETKALIQKLGQLSDLLQKGKNSISTCSDQLRNASKQIADLPLYQEAMDPLESRLEILMSKIEPVLGGVSPVDSSDSLAKEIETLQNEINTQNQNYTTEKKLSDQWLEVVNQVTLRISLAVENTTNDLKDPLKSLQEEMNSNIFEKESEAIEVFKKAIYEISSMKKKLALLKSLEDIQSKKTINYVAKQGDQLDVLVESAIHSYSSAKGGPLIPPNFERLGEGLYLFGTKRINTTILAGQLMVRVGGGFMTFEEFVLKYGRTETIKILRTPSKAQLKKQQSYQEVPMPFRPSSRAATRL